MAWIRIDDQFTNHPKVAAAGPLASWFYVCGLVYAGRYLTDGFIPAHSLPMLAVVPNPQELADILVSVGLWDQVEGGYMAHDYLEYNPSAATVKAERAASKERMQRMRGKRGSVTPEVTPGVTPVLQRSSPSPSPSPSPDSLLRNEDAPASADGATSAPLLSDASPVTQVRSSATSHKKSKPTGGGHKEQWDTLVQVFYQPKTKSECSNFGKVAVELREAGASGAEILRRAENHRVMRESGAIIWDLTLNALSKHWSELEEIKQPRAAPRPSQPNRPAPTPQYANTPTSIKDALANIKAQAAAASM